MTIVFAIVLVVHGLIHLLGVAKAFGMADLPRLTQPIPPSFGLLWLLAAALCLVTAASLFVWTRGWWMVGVCALFISLLAVVSSWSDAKFGLVPNGVLLVGVVFGFLSQGPYSLRAEYDADRARLLSTAASEHTVTEVDLTRLPAVVQRYLRLSGAVGRPHVHNFRARMHGRIRSGPDARWMPLAAEQYNVVAEPARLFYMTASMLGMPVLGYHRYVGSAASMRVKAAALLPVATAGGAEMTQSETVTLFNDMCVMAPATLIDRSIAWDTIDAHRVRARFSNAGFVIHADLWFSDSGELTNFVSDDRYQGSPDGATLRRVRWSTPVHGYRSFGAARLAAAGEGRWHEHGGEYAYIELTIDDVEYNVPDGEDSDVD
ncbi:MAG TPA: DUF6544 family protein [Vicinamibacterales bacterium]|nr:DUF6544 family protein [Vicinamibacterales bacterium]